jgi:hypothetical protein
VGAGLFLQGDALEPLLARARVRREPLVDAGLQFTRRRLGDERVYFVAHAGTAPVDGWMPLAAEGQSVALFDPMDGSRGYGLSRKGKDGGLEVYLQLHPGESTLLVAKAAPAAPDLYRHWRAAEAGLPIEGAWAVRFEEGGPERPGDVRTATLASWTAWGGEAVKAFSGTARYSISFPGPKARATAYALDLGAVHDSARVRLNGKDLATLIGPRFRLVIDGSSLAETNVLEVAVSNLMANRIASLDRQKVRWKKFYNVNFPARLPANRGPDGLFHADHWPPLPSGLLGPVTLTPLTAVVSPDGAAPN